MCYEQKHGTVYVCCQKIFQINIYHQHHEQQLLCHNCKRNICIIYIYILYYIYLSLFLCHLIGLTSESRNTCVLIFFFVTENSVTNVFCVVPFLITILSILDFPQHPRLSVNIKLLIATYLIRLSNEHFPSSEISLLNLNSLLSTERGNLVFVCRITSDKLKSLFSNILAF